MAGEPLSRALQSLSRLQELYATRIDTEVENLLDSYVGILKAAKLDEMPPKGKSDKFGGEFKHSKLGKARNDPTQTQKEKLQIAVRTENLVASSQSLLAMVNELKHIFLVSDFAEIGQATHSHEAQLRAQMMSDREALAQLHHRLTAARTSPSCPPYAEPPAL